MDEIDKLLQRIEALTTADYFPAIYEGFVEAEALEQGEDALLGIMSSYVLELWQNRNLLSMDDEKTSLFEKQLHIVPTPSQSLDDRRAAVADAINERFVLNDATLHEICQSLAPDFTVYEKTDPQELTLGVFTEEDDNQGHLPAVGIVNEIRPTVPQNLALYAGVDTSFDRPLVVSHAHFSALWAGLGVVEWHEPPEPPEPIAPKGYIVVDSTGAIQHSIPLGDMYIHQIQHSVEVVSFYFTSNGASETENTLLESGVDAPLYNADGSIADDDLYDGSGASTYTQVNGNMFEPDGGGDLITYSNGQLYINPDGDRLALSAQVEDYEDYIYLIYLASTGNYPRQSSITSGFSGTIDNTCTVQLFLDFAKTKLVPFDSYVRYEIGYYDATGGWYPDPYLSLSDLPSDTLPPSLTDANAQLPVNVSGYLRVWEVTNATEQRTASITWNCWQIRAYSVKFNKTNLPRESAYFTSSGASGTSNTTIQPSTNASVWYTLYDEHGNAILYDDTKSYSFIRCFQYNGGGTPLCGEIRFRSYNGYLQMGEVGDSFTSSAFRIEYVCKDNPNAMDIILALKWDKDNDEWKTVAFNQTPDDNFWWNGLLSENDKTKVVNFGLSTALDDPQYNSFGNIGAIVWDKRYTFEVLDLYSDLGQTSVSGYDLNNLRTSYLWVYGNNILNIWSDVQDSTPVMSWKCRIKKLPSLEIVVGVRWDSGTNNWIAPSFSGPDWFYAGILDPSDITTLANFGLSVSTEPGNAGPNGNILYSDDYYYDILELYSDLGSTISSYTNMSNLTMGSHSFSLGDILSIENVSAINSGLIMSYKLRITQKPRITAYFTNQGEAGKNTTVNASMTTLNVYDASGNKIPYDTTKTYTIISAKGTYLNNSTIQDWPSVLITNTIVTNQNGFICTYCGISSYGGFNVYISEVVIRIS